MVALCEAIKHGNAIEAELGLVVIRLAPRQLRLGLLHFVLIILLPHHSQHRPFLYPVALIDVAHASTGALDLANTVDIPAGLERQRDLCVGNDAG